MNPESLHKITVLMTAFFGFLAALAWNDLIQMGFLSLFSYPDPLVEMLLYAVFITIVAVLIAAAMGILARSARRRDL